MSSAQILVLGKAAIWFAVPLGLAAFELWRVRRAARRDTTTER